MLTMLFNPAKAALHALLVIAFISMQFSSAHIHLAKSHDHDGGQHDHANLGHSHALVGHHEDSFASALDYADDQVVELSQSFVLQGVVQSTDIAILLAYVIAPSVPTKPGYHLSFLTPSSSHSNWLNYSTVRLRAPPIFNV